MPVPASAHCTQCGINCIMPTNFAVRLAPVLLIGVVKTFCSESVILFVHAITFTSSIGRTGCWMQGIEFAEHAHVTPRSFYANESHICRFLGWGDVALWAYLLCPLICLGCVYLGQWRWPPLNRCFLLKDASKRFSFIRFVLSAPIYDTYSNEQPQLGARTDKRASLVCHHLLTYN